MGGLAGEQRGWRPQRDSAFVIGHRLNRRTSSQFCGKITEPPRSDPLYIFFMGEG